MLDFLFRQRKWLLFLVFFGCVFFADFASATTYYVNGTGGSYASATYPTAGSIWATGSDSNNGTSTSSPWATIGKALRSSAIHVGDTVYVASSTYIESALVTVALAAGSGTTSIIGDGVPSFSVSSSIQAYMVNFSGTVGSFVWDNIDVVNASLLNKHMFRLPVAGTYTFKNATFDFQSVASGNIGMWTMPANSSNINLVVESSILKNNNQMVVYNQNYGASSSITFSSDFFDTNEALVRYSATGPVDTYVYNCTVLDYNMSFVNIEVGGMDVVIANNIFIADPTPGYSVLRFNDTADDWFTSNPDRFIFTNNIFTNKPGHTLTEYNYVDSAFVFGSRTDNSTGVGDLFMVNNTKNWMLTMDFTDPNNNVYSISSESNLANGRGDAAYLPALDINGNAWSGNHVGAWPNPTTTTPTLSINTNTAVVFGDSIAYGSNADDSCPCSDESYKEGLACWFDYYDGGCSAGVTVYQHTSTTGEILDNMPGMRVQGGYLWVDQIMQNIAPETVFVIIGVNNLLNSSTYPGDTTETMIAETIIQTLHKIDEWGATPVWLGTPSTVNGDNNARVRNINALVEADCVANGWEYDSILERMENFDPSYTTKYYDYYTTDVHPNTLGHQFIGSMLENLYNNHSNYYIASSSVDSIIAGTYLHPLAITDFNSAVTIPTGQTGRTIIATGALATTLNTPSGGSADKILTLRGGNWTAGMVIDQNYWLLENLLISGSNASSRGLTIAGTNVIAQNLTINGSADVGVYAGESCTLKNVVVANSTGSDMEILDAKTVTGYNNFFQDALNAGLGTYTNAGGTIWSGGDAYFVDPSSPNFYLRAHSPLIDVGTTISGRTTDYLGNSFYSSPDIGAYEFQPTEVVGVNYINTSANVRIFTDGKFRNTSATSTAATNNFSVTPLGGSFSTGDSVWMNVSFTNWQTTSTQNKAFTASSTIATTTIFTVGDLGADRIYTIKLDGAVTSTIIGSSCTNSICTADGSGVIVFTYSGGYSSHDFTIEQDATGPDAFTLATPLNSATTTDQTPTFTWNASADSVAGLAKYQLYIDDVLNIDNISSVTLSTTTASTLSYGAHTWYVKALDNNNNETTSTVTFTLTIVDEIAPSAFTLSLPANNTSNSSKKPTLTWSASTDTGIGLASYSVYVDSVLSASGISSSTPSFTLTTDLSCGAHTWYVKAVDGSSNETSSDIFTYTVICSTGGGAAPISIPPVFSSATPIKVSTIMSDGKTELNFFVNDAVQMAISDSPNFFGISWEPYVDVKNYKTNKNIFYVKFRSKDGAETAVQKVVVNLDGSTKDVSTQPPLTPAYTFTQYLVYGMRSNEVKQLQIRLQELGYLSKSITPVTNFGPSTRAAVIKLQKDHNLKPPAGYVGPGTRAVLNSYAISNTVTTPVIPQETIVAKTLTPAYTFTQYLVYGMRSNEVKQLQIRLQELGYLSKSITPVTNFGPSTRAAVIKLQKDHNLKPPAGYVGPGTRAVLNQ